MSKLQICTKRHGQGCARAGLKQAAGDHAYLDLLLEFREFCAARGWPFRPTMMQVLREWLSKG